MPIILGVCQLIDLLYILLKYFIGVFLMACLDECCSLCAEGFITDIKRMVHKQSRRINDYISYVLQYITEDYTLLKEDTAGDILLLCQNIAPIKIIVPTEAVGGFREGCAVSIVQDSNFSVSIWGSEGVTFSPPDATITRRNGSAITIVYQGGDLWRVVGELA